MKVASTFRRQEKSKEHGITMVLVAAAMVAIIGIAAMSIDLVTLYLAREEAQRAADAAALAAARIISASGITGALDPQTTNIPFWSSICGGAAGWATQTAQAVAAQNSVGGQSVALKPQNVTYSDGTSNSDDCTDLGPNFGVNPLITVQVASINIPSFFSRIWGRTGNNISASATAEVFNPSASDTNGILPNKVVTPVQPRCVKPWIVPNIDPGHCSLTSSTNCQPFVAQTNGQILHPGIAVSNTSTAPAVIGESFYLFADCSSSNTTSCSPVLGITGAPAQANVQSGPFIAGPPVTPNLEYLPGAVPQSSSAFSAVPSCAPASYYAKAVSGCDQTTVYQCGLQVGKGGTPNQIALSENPAGTVGSDGDTAQGLACSLTGNVNAGNIPLQGQDSLRTTSYPFVPFAGDANPLGLGGTSTTPITASNSIVSLPIYDPSTAINSTGTTDITIVGFLQVFVERIDIDVKGNLGVFVRVLNVAGCGSNATTNPPVFGSSPLPVRLITPPS
jgi:hypothetical protein